MFNEKEVQDLIDEALMAGRLLFEQRRIREADVVINQLLKVAPDNIDALELRGLCFHEKRKFSKAIEIYKEILEKHPERVGTHNNIALSYSCLRDYDTAIEHLKKAGEEPGILCNLATQYRRKEQFDLAEECCNQALEQRESAGTLVNLAGVFTDQNRFDRAVDLLKRAVELDERYFAARMDLSYAYHALGEWEKGMEEYEHRFLCYGHLKDYGVKYPASRCWRGGEYDKLTVFCEQGVGDYFNFVRFVKDMPNVEVVTPEPLRSFMEKQGITVADGPGDSFHCSMLSLPHIRKIPLDKVCKEYPYLKSTKEANFKKYPGYKVGLVWAGSPQHMLDEFRSIPLNKFEPLCSIPNIHLFSLQKDLLRRVWGGGDPVDLSEGCEGMKLIDMSEHMNNWEDTAALVAGMDLIITVDTAVLHLAGAMGKKTWGLIPFNPDWRWGLSGETTPWYPSVRLLRQPKRRDWKSVIDLVIADLTSEALAQPSTNNM
jgi:Tfp pilus assembly protein PilF